MQVDVGHTLADDFVQRVERAFSPEHFLLGGGHAPAGCQHWAQEAGGRLGQGRIVSARDNQRMPVENGAVVEEDQELALVKDHVCGDFALDDLVKDAFLRGDEITLCLAYERYPSRSGSPRNGLARSSA
jgi:hypothetical protein